LLAGGAGRSRSELAGLRLDDVSPAGRPMTASGIYQVIERRGRQAGVAVSPHKFRHTFSHNWQMGRIASDASFGRLRERALPAAQRVALRRARRAVAPDARCDLGFYGLR
jgi:integrase